MSYNVLIKTLDKNLSLYSLVESYYTKILVLICGLIIKSIEHLIITPSLSFPHANPSHHFLLPSHIFLPFPPQSIHLLLNNYTSFSIHERNYK